MNFSYLKRIRIIVSILFFIPITFLFLDFSFHFAEKFSQEILFLQFIPSLISFVSIVGVSSAGFVLILLLTLLLGRVYCSSICPLGTLQDIISFIKKKYSEKKAYKPNRDYRLLKYSLLIFTLVLFFSGFSLGISILDPYSNFGRLTTHLAKPIFILGNNFLSFVFEYFDYYFFYPHEIKSTSLISLIYSSLFVIILIVLVTLKGRLFCNTICPVGIILGLVSKLSLIKISIDEYFCSSCNSCTRVCKAGCIDKENKNIDFSRCVSCYNCFSVCPSGGISFQNSFKKSLFTNKFSSSRRKLLTRSISYSSFMTGLAFAQLKINPKKESKYPVLKINHVTPPGSNSISHFNQYCTACHLCVSACPTQVLQPSLFEYGISGFLQPVMDYKTSFCNYDCKICIDICPTGALSKLTIDNKKIIQLGKAIFIKENCIVETEKTECGACSEHCPTKAVRMIPYQGITIPEVKEEYCVGCGACEYACPTKPHKSIYVEGNVQHKLAKIPPKETLERQPKEDEFPF